MQIREGDLIEEVMWRGAIGDRDRAQAAIATALNAVGTNLGSSERAVIAEQLPAPFAAAVEQPPPSAALRPSDLYARLASSEQVSLGLAVEHARAACSAVAELLDGRARSLIARQLPPEWAALCAPVALAAEADVPAGTVPGHGHTLATGRPGSQHPLAEAAPRPAQSDSVVTAANPHGERKLSSAREAPETTGLATARPGSEHPIVEAKDQTPRR